MADYLANHGIDPNGAQGKVLMELASTAIGGAVGKTSGASTALQGEQYNRQLHPDYVKHVQSLTREYAEQQCSCSLDSLSTDEAQAALDNASKALLTTAQRMQDAAFDQQEVSKGVPVDTAAEAFLAKDNYGEWIGGTYYDLAHATTEERLNPTINGYTLYQELNKNANGGLGDLMAATGYSLGQYAALAQLDYNSGRPQAQAFDVDWQQFQNADAISFLKFNGGLALGGAAGGVGAASPLFNAALTGYALGSGADELSQGHYVSGGLQMVGGVFGLGLWGQQAKEASSLSGLIWSPLGGTAAGIGNVGVYNSSLWQSLDQNDPLTLKALQSLYGEANVVQGGGTVLQTAERVNANVAQSQLGNAASNFGQFNQVEGRLYEVLGIWPPNGGGYAPVYDRTLDVGMRLDRYGYPGGSYLSLLGSSFEGRSLPPSYLTNKPYFKYEVIKSINGVTESHALPWFGQKGMDIQFKTPNSVQWYIDNGYMREVKK
jgi:hypothetical protein